ncbi:hypothetical protein P43SY_002399 [Pythium insidiosum]|uniref:WIBG Mago-binding domain-containing protein n=1 Tax=Pythium insidiosum TaxID=114742 RepID=A0AAD5LDY9_PYTIN|nr:hypothetical protein P43SY_002399 [Pythium insidiosum]
MYQRVEQQPPPARRRRRLLLPLHAGLAFGAAVAVGALAPATAALSVASSLVVNCEGFPATRPYPLYAAVVRQPHVSTSEECGRCVQVWREPSRVPLVAKLRGFCGDCHDDITLSSRFDAVPRVAPQWRVVDCGEPHVCVSSGPNATIVRIANDALGIDSVAVGEEAAQWSAALQGYVAQQPIAKHRLRPLTLTLTTLRGQRIPHVIEPLAGGEWCSSLIKRARTSASVLAHPAFIGSLLASVGVLGAVVAYRANRKRRRMLQDSAVSSLTPFTPSSVSALDGSLASTNSSLMATTSRTAFVVPTSPRMVIPSSRRADGSIRKQIRVRQGYIPQDEVPKYKPIGQRLREQAEKEQTPRRDDSHAASEAITSQMQSLEITPSSSLAKNARSPRSERGGNDAAESKTPHKPQSVASLSASGASTRELKNELSSVNRLLREIAKLEAIAQAAARQEEGARPLSDQQQRKVRRKQELTTRRDEIIALLPPREATQRSKQRSSSDLEAKPRTLRTIEL